MLQETYLLNLTVKIMIFYNIYSIHKNLWQEKNVQYLFTRPSADYNSDARETAIYLANRISL